MTDLSGKCAVVLAAAGSIGAAVAKEFAANGGEVFVSGRTRAKVDALAAGIVAAGGRAHAAEVNAENEAAVDSHFADIANRTGHIDVVFNAMEALLNVFGKWKSEGRLDGPRVLVEP